MVAPLFPSPPTAPLGTPTSPVAAATSGVLVTLVVIGMGIILAVAAVLLLIRCVCVCEVRWYTHMSVLHTVLCVLYTIFLSYA